MEERTEHIRKRPGMYIGRLGSGANEQDGIYNLLKIVFYSLIRQFREGISSIRRMSCSGSDLKIISQTPKQPPYMKIRVIYNYFLKILGIREMLPGDILRSKPIRESHETLVYFTPCDGLFLNGVKMLCRQSVAEKLKRVAKQLSERIGNIHL